MSKKKLPLYVKLDHGGYGYIVQAPGHRSKSFGFKKHGGRAQALYKAAQHAQRLADRARANPRTGRFVRDPGATEGVFPATVRRGEYVYRVWVAEWSPEPGKRKQAKFSVGKWGERGARQKALDKRREMVKELLKD